MSEASLVDTTVPEQSAIVNLNVGGTVFTTLEDTLNDAGGIFPHMLKHTDLWPKDSRGRIFLDRDPKRFRILLDWLRNKDRPFKYRITEDMKMEMEHFGLFANLLYEKMTGMLLHVQGKRLLPIERMTLFTVTIDGEEYNHRQYDGCMLRTS